MTWLSIFILTGISLLMPHQLKAQESARQSLSDLQDSNQDQESTRKTMTTETYSRQGRMDDFSPAQERAESDQKSLQFLFKKSESRTKPPQQLKLRVLEGPGTSGGGDIVRCGDYKFRLFSESDYPRYFLADTVDLFKNGVIQKDSPIPEEAWMDAIFETFNETSPHSPPGQKLGDLVKERLSQLVFVPSAGALADLPDDRINVQVLGCHEKFQLAVQDLETGTVRVDFKMLSRLSYPEIYFFKIHEALISLKKTEDDTSPIRKELRDAIEKISIQNTMEKVMKNFVTTPQSAQMLWTLKVLRSDKGGSLRLEPCQKQETERDDKRCLFQLLSQEIQFENRPYSNGIELLAENLRRSGFSYRLNGKRDLPKEMSKHQRDVLSFVYATSQYLHPRHQLVRKSSVNLAQMETMHAEWITAVRKIQYKNNLGDFPNLVNILNEDFQLFRKLMLADHYQSTLQNFTLPEDQLVARIGTCFRPGYEGYQSLSAVAPSHGVDFRLQLGRVFMKCLLAKESPLRKVNPADQSTTVMENLGAAFGKGYLHFAQKFQQYIH